MSKIINSIPKNLEYSFDNPQLFTKEVSLSFARHIDEVRLMFSGSELPNLGLLMNIEIKKVIFSRYPQYKDDPRLNVLLSYCILGALNAQLTNPDVPAAQVTDIITEITTAISPLYKEKAMAVLQDE